MNRFYKVSNSNNFDEYPISRIMNKYQLYSGGIGGLIVAMITLVTSLTDGSGFNSLVIILVTLLSLLFGSILGYFPALLAATIICKLKIYFDSLLSGFKIFTIGLVSTFICIFWLLLGDSPTDMLFIVTSLCMIGGVSAVITGWIALPKNKLTY